MPTVRSLPRTPLALTVLMLLAEEPMHPYEMKVRMRDRAQERAVNARGGSLYDTVERLARLGLIEPLETSREGRRPERTVYQITEAGTEEAELWLRELLSQPAADFPRFAIGLMFMVGLRRREEVVKALQHRVVGLEAEIAGSDAILRGMRNHRLPRIFMIEDEYLQAMRRAEVEWVRDLIRELESGSLPWPLVGQDRSLTWPEPLQVIEGGGDVT